MLPLPPCSPCSPPRPASCTPGTLPAETPSPWTESGSSRCPRPEPGRDPDIGFRVEWFSGPGLPPPTLAMPVPASYNDITLDSGLRDYVGWAWYDRTFYASSGWRDQRVLLRSHSKHK